MTKTHRNTKGGDKWGKATLKSELKIVYIGVYARVAMHKKDASNTKMIRGCPIFSLSRCRWMIT
jgi:hypothetical protein